MLKKGSSALKAAYLGSVIISLQVCRCAVPKRLRRRRNEQTNCDKCRSCAADTRQQCRDQVDTPHPSHVNASRRRTIEYTDQCIKANKNHDVGKFTRPLNNLSNTT